eukprot:642103-Rhodomonas_salina.1
MHDERRAALARSRTPMRTPHSGSQILVGVAKEVGEVGRCGERCGEGGWEKRRERRGARSNVLEREGVNRSGGRTRKRTVGTHGVQASE